MRVSVNLQIYELQDEAVIIEAMGNIVDAEGRRLMSLTIRNPNTNPSVTLLMTEKQADWIRSEMEAAIAGKQVE